MKKIIALCLTLVMIVLAVVSCRTTGEGDGSSTPQNSIPNPPATSDTETSETPAASVFTDVPADQYYAQPVAWAVEKGITNGTSATTFSPNDTCTNAQILTFMWRAAGSPAMTSNPFTNLTGTEYYYNAALWAYENGMVTNVDSIQGSYYSTRANVVTYLNKAFGK